MQAKYFTPYFSLHGIPSVSVTYPPEFPGISVHRFRAKNILRTFTCATPKPRSGFHCLVCAAKFTQLSTTLPPIRRIKPKSVEINPDFEEINPRFEKNYPKFEGNTPNLMVQEEVIVQNLGGIRDIPAGVVAVLSPPAGPS